MEVNELDPVPADARVAPEGTPEKQSVREAAQLLAALRKKEEEPASDAPPPPPELSAEDNAAPAEEPPSDEPTEQPEPVAEELPSLEPPRSWTTEDKETFKSLPRETQERLVNIDRERELAVRRVQNETAEQRKQLDERLKEAEQVRLQYEKALPTILEVLQQAQMGEYADIKTPADERKVAQEDPVRYMQYLAKQREVALAQNELMQAQSRQQQEQVAKWQAFAQKEDALFVERNPEFKGPTADTASREIMSMLKDTGFTEQEIAQAYSTERLARDHRMQEIFWKAAKYDKAQKTVKAAPKKALPPVQRPGAAQPVGMAEQQRIENLSKRLDKTANVRDAAQLIQAMRRTRKA